MNTNDDSAIAANIAIKQDDIKANPLFTRAYRLYILFERVLVCVVKVKGSDAARDLALAVWGYRIREGQPLSSLEAAQIANSLTSTIMTEVYVAHRIIRKLAHWGVWAFFARFQVINGENMPDGGPVIMWVSLQ